MSLKQENTWKKSTLVLVPVQLQARSCWWEKGRERAARAGAGRGCILPWQARLGLTETHRGMGSALCSADV